MVRKKILYITSEFWKGGSQRLLYEINKSISKDLFNTSILSLRNLNSDSNWDDYYYSKHIELNSTIYFQDKINKLRHPSLKERINKKIFGLPLPNERKPLVDFLNSFDFLLFIGEYTYTTFEKFLSQEMKSKSYISIVFSRYQEPDNFINYNKNIKHNFISGFTNDEIKFELAEFKDYNHFHLPLSISFDKKLIWKPKKKQIKKIGIFTRLTHAKPIDIFLYALHLINEDNNNIILNIYGNGDPKEFDLPRKIQYLSLGNNVFFKGDQENIKESAIRDELDLVWFHGYHETPGGFASFDISSIALPQIFWNFSTSYDKPKQNIFPMFSKLSKFIKASCEILYEPEKAIDLGKKQFNHVFENRNMSSNIKMLENTLLNEEKKNNSHNKSK